MWICFTKLKARIHSKLLFFSYASWTEGKCLLTNTQGSGSFTHLRIWTLFPRYMPLILDCDAIGVRKHFSAKKTICPFSKSWDTNSMEKENVHRGPGNASHPQQQCGPGYLFLHSDLLHFIPQVRYCHLACGWPERPFVINTCDRVREETNLLSRDFQPSCLEPTRSENSNVLRTTNQSLWHFLQVILQLFQSVYSHLAAG